MSDKAAARAHLEHVIRVYGAEALASSNTRPSLHKRAVKEIDKAFVAYEESMGLCRFCVCRQNHPAGCHCENDE